MPTTSVTTLPLHPFALLLPAMQPDELDALTASIAASGQQVPATSWTDAAGIEWLLDGRHRARACAQLDVPLVVERLSGDEHAARAYVLAANIYRRHLSASQRAVAASALSTRGRGRVEIGSPASLTQAEAAAAAGVSLRLVRAARTFADDQKLTQSVLAGALTVTAAAAERRAAHAERIAAARQSVSDEWLTPAHILHGVERVLGGIDGDVCAEPGRRVPAQWWLTEDDDAFSVPTWANPDGSPSTIFMNAPWASAGQFVRRLLREFDAGNVSAAVVLLPARLGSEYVASLTSRGWPRVELTGRLKFLPGRGAIPGGQGVSHFSSMLIGVGVEPAAINAEFGALGPVLVAFGP
ncbi:ParB N-terminal domain-containing protein [Microbacterium sp. A84]|uniref:ParB N-terminal domain-containing protein n=1 Tax=Microbacterium sp. A84 TaxID=3450715 RepID=UPI003F4335C5